MSHLLSRSFLIVLLSISLGHFLGLTVDAGSGSGLHGPDEDLGSKKPVKAVDGSPTDLFTGTQYHISSRWEGRSYYILPNRSHDKVKLSRSPSHIERRSWVLKATSAENEYEIFSVIAGAYIDTAAMETVPKPCVHLQQDRLPEGNLHQRFLFEKVDGGYRIIAKANPAYFLDTWGGAGGQFLHVHKPSKNKSTLSIAQIFALELVDGQFGNAGPVGGSEPPISPSGSEGPSGSASLLVPPPSNVGGSSSQPSSFLAEDLSAQGNIVDSAKDLVDFLSAGLDSEIFGHLTVLDTDGMRQRTSQTYERWGMFHKDLVYDTIGSINELRVGSFSRMENNKRYDFFIIASKLCMSCHIPSDKPGVNKCGYVVNKYSVNWKISGDSVRLLKWHPRAKEKDDVFREISASKNSGNANVSASPLSGLSIGVGVEAEGLGATEQNRTVPEVATSFRHIDRRGGFTWSYVLRSEINGRTVMSDSIYSSGEEPFQPSMHWCWKIDRAAALKDGIYTRDPQSGRNVFTFTPQFGVSLKKAGKKTTAKPDNEYISLGEIKILAPGDDHIIDRKIPFFGEEI